MHRCFNINGLCYPDENYMVDLDSRLREIKKLVDSRKYFVINRARQFGKTTTLWALKNYLQTEYTVLSLSFQRLSTQAFADEASFSKNFLNMLFLLIHNKRTGITGLDGQALNELEEAGSQELTLTELFVKLSNLCETSAKPIVLIVDEVDSATNNQVFLDFLALLRDYYLDRKQSAIFHSVILAGVYDIKNLKRKLRSEDEHRYNSPWNIAADFNIDMSFSQSDIATMLESYVGETGMDMDIPELAVLIYDYTSGYPYFVSYICKIIDEDLTETEQQKTSWSKQGVTEAIKYILGHNNTLFDDMTKKLSDYPELREILYKILFDGQSFPYNPNNEIIGIGTMFGFIKNEESQVAVSNRIFETWFYNLFISEEALSSQSYKAASEIRNQFFDGNELDMELVLTKFMQHFTEIYSDCTESFKEENGRRLFLMYLKPIINGTGNYYVESQTRNQRRTDIIVDYLGEQYIVELKIWHGPGYNEKGEKQLADYLEYYKKQKGYLISFNFNKNKRPLTRRTECEGKTIFEVIL